MAVVMKQAYEHTFLQTSPTSRVAEGQRESVKVNENTQPVKLSTLILQDVSNLMYNLMVRNQMKEVRKLNPY